MSPIAFKIAEGYVEIKGRLDRAQVRQTAEKAGDRYGDVFGQAFERRFTRQVKGIQSSLSGLTGGRTADIKTSFDPGGARQAADKAGSDSGNMFTRAFSRHTSGIRDLLAGLFKPNPELFRFFLNPMEKVLSAPMGAAAASLGIVFVAGLAASILQSGLLLGLGAGIGVAIGFGLKNNKQVQEAAKSMMDRIKKVVEDASAPLAGPVSTAMGTIAAGLERMEPAFTRISTALTPVAGLLATTFVNFLEAMLPGIEKAMPGVVKLFETLALRAGDLGTAVGNFFAKLTEDPNLIPNFNAVLDTMVKILEAAPPVIAFVGDQFAELRAIWNELRTDFENGRAMFAIVWNSLVESAVTGTQGIITAVGTMAVAVLGIVAKAFFWKPKFAEAANDGIAEVNRLVGVSNSLLDRIQRNVTIRVDADVAPFRAAIGALRYQPGVGIGVYAKATGGIIGASSAAGGGPRGATTLVGEQGPELVKLPFGSMVKSNPDTRAVLSGSGGGQQVVVEIHPPRGGSAFERAVFEMLRTGVRVRGGNVQTALGR